MMSLVKINANNCQINDSFKAEVSHTSQNQVNLLFGLLHSLANSMHAANIQSLASYTSDSE